MNASHNTTHSIVANTYSVLVVKTDYESKWSAIEILTGDERILKCCLSGWLNDLLKFDSCELQDKNHQCLVYAVKKQVQDFMEPSCNLRAKPHKPQQIASYCDHYNMAT